MAKTETKVTLIPKGTTVVCLLDDRPSTNVKGRGVHKMGGDNS